MTIVVPVIAGSKANYALSRAVKYARRTDGQLIAVLSRPHTEYSQDDIDSEIDTLTDYLDNEDIAFRIETRVDEEELASQLCEVAAERNAEVVMVSLALKPANGKLNLGSQVQRLLLEAPCDVLVLREDSFVPATGS